jgi:hypothetical protein
MWHAALAKRLRCALCELLTESSRHISTMTLVAVLHGCQYQMVSEQLALLIQQ